MATRPNPQDLVSILHSLERRVFALETGNGINYASIQDGGALVVLDASNNPVLRIGSLSIGGYGIERWNGTAWVAVT